MRPVPNTTPMRRMAFRSASRSHAGARRALNEDRVLDRSETGLWAIADGMGGHSAGDLAAARVIADLAAVDHGASGYTYLDDIAGAVAAANAALFAQREGPEGRVSGATLVALVAHEGHYACLWAGDSRAYRLRDGVLSPITRDHSVVQELIDAGALDEASRRRHPGAHVVTRAVGAQSSVELDRRFAPIEPGDLFLLCSDGLTGCVDESALAQLAACNDVDSAADSILALALDRHPADNLSFILISALKS